MYLPRTFLESIGLQRGLPAIFVHTPKCGGSYIAEGIGHRRERRCFTRRHPSLKGHRTYLEYRAAFPALGLDIADYLTFSVVRNPWEWHVSFYHYLRQLTGRDRKNTLEINQLLNAMSFSEYLAWLDDEAAPKPRDLWADRQVSDWVVDETGKIVVDVVMRQERLEEDFTGFIETYGLRLTPPTRRVNASSHKDYRTYFSDADAERVAKRHARDLALFGYRFEG